MINNPKTPIQNLGRRSRDLSLTVSLTSTLALWLVACGLFANEPDVIQLEALPSKKDRPVVSALSLTSDGSLMAAAGDDHAIRLFSLRDRSLHFLWQGHIDWVRSVRFSPNGRWLASCANDGQLQVLDVQNKKLFRSQQVPHALQDICFSDEETLFAVGFHGNVYRWDLKKESLEIDHTSDCFDLRSIVFCPITQKLAYGGRDGVLRLRTVSSEGTAPYCLMPAHFERIRSLSFSSDGRILTSVGEDRRLIHFDINSKAILGTLELKGGKLVALCPIDQETFAVAGSDNTINLVTWNKAEPRVRLIGHDGTVTLLQKTDRRLVSSSFDTTIRIWDLEKAEDQRDDLGRYVHPVAAQFEDSGALSKQGVLVRKPNR